MESSDYEDVRRVLNERDIALLSKEFLLTLSKLDKPLSNGVLLDDIYKAMSLNAYNLQKVIPFILNDYLIPYKLVELHDDKVKLTLSGRQILPKIDLVDISWKEILNIIESTTVRSEDFSDIVLVLKKLLYEIEELNRPRIFFNIVPVKVNVLNMILRNSGRSPAYNISCSFDPDLPYYENLTLSSLFIFKNLPFLEQSQEINLFYKNFIDVVNDEESTKKTNIIIKYKDSRGNIYTEKYPLDLDTYKGLLMPVEADMYDIHKDLDNIRKQLDYLQKKGLVLRSSNTGNLSNQIKEEKFNDTK